MYMRSIVVEGQALVTAAVRRFGEQEAIRFEREAHRRDHRGRIVEMLKTMGREHEIIACGGDRAGRDQRFERDVENMIEAGCRAFAAGENSTPS